MTQPLKKFLLRFSVIILFVLIFAKLFAQDDSVTDSIKRNAVFLSFEEFKNNEPSIDSINIFLEGKSNGSFVLKYQFDSSGKIEKYKKRLWGFSDSSFVYIKHDGYYGRFIEIGKLCMFTYHFKYTRSVSYGIPGTITGTHTMRQRYEGDKTFVLVYDTGEIIELLPKNMEKIITDDPDLLVQFNKEEDQDNEKRFYIWKYNERHPLK